jgi:hypothetical protein
MEQIYHQRRMGNADNNCWRTERAIQHLKAIDEFAIMFTRRLETGKNFSL